MVIEPSTSVRTRLLREALRFVQDAAQLPGVERIAVVGSIVALDTITLDPAVIAEPPLEVYPSIRRRAVVPPDVAAFLAQLEGQLR